MLLLAVYVRILEYRPVLLPPYARHRKAQNRNNSDRVRVVCEKRIYAETQAGVPGCSDDSVGVRRACDCTQGRTVGEKAMSKPRDLWWSYARAMIRAYPDRTTSEEREAVQTAIEKTESKVDGRDRMKVINFMYFQKGTKPDRRDLEYAALKVPCQYETAKRWHREFVNEVGRNFRCNGLPKH